MPPVKDRLDYSYKCRGIRSCDNSMNMSSAFRYISPHNFIEQLFEKAKLKGVEFKFGYNFVFGGYGNTISTISLPDLLDSIKCRPEIFKTVDGFNLIANAKDTDAYFTTYIVDRGYAMSRLSVTGNTVIAEFPNKTPESGYDYIKHSKYELESISGYYNIDIRDPRSSEPI